MDPHTHNEQIANLDRIIAHQREFGQRLDQIQAQAAEPCTAEPAVPHPLDPERFETTIAQARRMAEREAHPTWFQAAYADLVQRLARVEDLLEDLGANMSLLHTRSCTGSLRVIPPTLQPRDNAPLAPLWEGALL